MENKEYDASPQTIEGNDGFPMRNPAFKGDYHELRDVATGRKPIAIVSRNTADMVYPSLDGLSRGSLKKELKNARLHFMPYAGKPGSRDQTVIAYTDATAAQARALRKIHKSYDRLGRMYHIVYGLLLGYRMRDIRAWHLAGVLSELYCMEFFRNRSEIVRSRPAHQVRDEYARRFMVPYAGAVEVYRSLLKGAPLF
jgi:hypothetical protein